MKAAHDNSIVSKSLPSIPAGRLKGHNGPIHMIRLTKDGKYCLSAGNDRTVRLWNPTKLDPACAVSAHNRTQLINTKSSVSNPSKSFPIEFLPKCLPIQTYFKGHSHPIHAISVNDDSTTLLSSSDRTLIVTDIVSTNNIRRLQGHSSRINSVTSSSSGELYLSASYDGTVRIWDGKSHSKDPVQILSDANDSVTTVLLDQGHLNDNNSVRQIVTAGVDGIIRTYDLRKGMITNDSTGIPITNMVFSNDGNCLLLNGLDGILRFMERDSGQLLSQYSGSHIAGKYGLECAMSATDEYVLTGSEDGNIVIYDLVNKSEVQKLLGHSRPTCSIAAQVDIKHPSVTISASFDGNAVVWANIDEISRWD